MFDLRAMFDNMHKCVDGTVLGHDLSGIFSVSCELFMLYIVIVNTFMFKNIYRHSVGFIPRKQTMSTASNAL